MPAAVVTVAEGSKEGGSNLGGQGTGSRDGRAAVAVATGAGDGGGSGRRKRRLWKTRARLWLRWLGEEKI